MSAAASPLLEALATLARAGVEFIVVGVSGINFYARDASDAVVTADVDVFLSPRIEVLRSALGGSALLHPHGQAHATASQREGAGED